MRRRDVQRFQQPNGDERDLPRQSADHRRRDVQHRQQSNGDERDLQRQSATTGGGMYNTGSSPTLTNVTFTDNSATVGGGMHNTSGSNPTLTNVTFGGNSASSTGGGMYNFGCPGGCGNPQVRNTIFWGNTAPTGAQIYNEYYVAAIVSDSVVQGGYPGGSNILTDDPNWVARQLRRLHTRPSRSCRDPPPSIPAMTPPAAATDQRGVDPPARRTLRHWRV